jgi:hypothetical protein
MGPHEACNSVRMLLALTSVARLPPAKLGRLSAAHSGWRSYDAVDARPSRLPRIDIAPVVVTVTPATSISFFRPELDDFLHGSIGMERNEMPLSVLSALARLDLDPWKEAVELSELPRDCAAQRLAALIVRLPGGRWTQAEAGGIAHRLIALLPSRGRPSVPLIEKANGIAGKAVSPTAKMLICAALVGIALISAASCEPSSGADRAWSRTTEIVPHPARR